VEHDSPAVAEQQAPQQEIGRSSHAGLFGSLVLAYWLLDGLVFGIPVVILAAWLNPLVVFIVAAAVLVPLNIVCCRWLDRNWDGWLASHGKRIEGKLQKLRKGRVMSHPVRWVTGGSDGLYVLAAAVTSAITVVSLARLIGGRPVGGHRALVAAVTYGLFCSGIWALIGFAAGDAIRAL
jgi:hypothetical protein